MIKNTLRLKKFNQALIAREKLSFKKALAIFEELYKEARRLKAIDPDKPLEGIETDLRIARALNHIS